MPCGFEVRQDLADSCVFRLVDGGGGRDAPSGAC